MKATNSQYSQSAPTEKASMPHFGKRGSNHPEVFNDRVQQVCRKVVQSVE
ncbi:hypothetical protein [Piscinibacter sp.]|jgi:hypothetical protein